MRILEERGRSDRQWLYDDPQDRFQVFCQASRHPAGEECAEYLPILHFLEVPEAEAVEGHEFIEELSRDDDRSRYR